MNKALEILLKDRQGFVQLCRKHHVRRLYAFGSLVSGQYDPVKSDIDLVVEIDATDPVERGELLLSLWDALENFLKKKVDLLTPDSIRNPVLGQSIANTKTLIYDSNRQEILT